MPYRPYDFVGLEIVREDESFVIRRGRGTHGHDAVQHLQVRVDGAASVFIKAETFKVYKFTKSVLEKHRSIEQHYFFLDDVGHVFGMVVKEVDRVRSTSGRVASVIRCKLPLESNATHRMHPVMHWARRLEISSPSGRG